MYKKLFVIYLLAIGTINAATSRGGGAGGRAGKYATYESNYASGRRMYYGGGGQPMYNHENQTPAQTPKEYLDEHSGYSTFGIIAIIFIIIVCCLAFYYGIMCYPILCGQEKKYRYMSDISSTITTATSSSIHSIENYPGVQKQQTCI